MFRFELFEVLLSNVFYLNYYTVEKLTVTIVTVG